MWNSTSPQHLPQTVICLSVGRLDFKEGQFFVYVVLQFEAEGMQYSGWLHSGNMGARQ